MDIAIVDVGLGNVRSVERALLRAASDAHVAANVLLTSDVERIARADKIVVPGQGAFRDCSRALTGGMGQVLRERIAAGTPYFGICLGLQVLFEASEEAAGCAGLGVFEGNVARLPEGIDASTGAPRKIPHIGWNVAEPRLAEGSGAARGWLAPAPDSFYFVHSYAVRPRDPALVAAMTEYGERFVSAIARDNVFACQFHPEKSQGAGLALLARFVAS